MLPEFHLCAGEWMGDTQDQVAAYIEDRRTSKLSMVWGVLHVPALWVTIGWFRETGERLSGGIEFWRRRRGLTKKRKRGWIWRVCGKTCERTRNTMVERVL